MILTQKEMDYYRGKYPHMNQFSLVVLVTNLFDTIKDLQQKYADVKQELYEDMSGEDL